MMAIKLQTKGNFKYVTNALEDINDGFETGNFLEETAQLLNSSIQIRVQKEGIGLNSNKMKSYSQPWAKKRAATGRQTGFRDLTYTGKMFQSLTTTKRKRSAKMFFANAESVNKASGNQARTPFFGLADREKEVLKNAVRDFVSKIKR